MGLVYRRKKIISMKRIYTGPESQGKSLQLARELRSIVLRNARWQKKTKLARPILCNMALRRPFTNWAASKGVEIRYWNNLEDIIYRTECDIFIDEIVKYFDARNWQNLGLDAKHFLTQGAKSGIHVYGAAQDLSQIEKQFRLLITECYNVTKLIGSPRPMKTAPPVRFIWGICTVRQVDPKTFKGDSITMESKGIPWPFLIQREDCDIFDTNAKVIPSDPPRLKHETRFCEHYGEPNHHCNFSKVTHT